MLCLRIPYHRRSRLVQRLVDRKQQSSYASSTLVRPEADGGVQVSGIYHIFQSFDFMAAARIEGRTDAQIEAETGGWILRTPAQV